MKCPICSTWAIRLETRSNAMYNTVRRRYECGNLHRFTTLEKVARVIKPKGKHAS